MQLHFLDIGSVEEYNQEKNLLKRTQQMLVSAAGHDELFGMNPTAYERRVMICIDDSGI
jgi:hypothetical protein